MTSIALNVREQWNAIEPILTIRSEQEYDQSIERLKALIDEVGTDQSHPLYTLLDTLGTIIEAYEKDHYVIPEASAHEVLSYLMEEHSIDESNLIEIGDAEAVDDFLKGNYTLNVNQIRALAKRFHVSPSVFI